LLHINTFNEAIKGGIDEKDTITKIKVKVNEDANKLKIYLSNIVHEAHHT
jgi:hypothetical protein